MIQVGKIKDLKLVNYGSSNVCIYNQRYSPGSGWYQSGWVCSKNGVQTSMLGLGDDTGWKNQGFKLVNYGTSNVCIYNQRYSPGSGWYQSGWVCSKNGVETSMLSLGDDTGWKNQGFKLVNY